MRNKFLMLFAVAAMFLVSGCSVWEDFTTYFNLYYNTTDLFDQAETSIKEVQKDPFSLVELPLPGNAQTQLTKVIEKCSKILQFQTKSAFVDDALLMIGKSFYYQKSYIKAIRKFEELQGSHPESDLVLESQLWLAKSDMQMKNSEKGLALLRSVRETAIRKDEKEIATNAFIEEIRYYLIMEDYEKVQSLCMTLLSYSNNSTLKAKVAFELGDINEKQGKIKEATEAYASVSDYSASYDLLFNASLRYAKMLIKLNENQKALRLLSDLRSELKYKEFYDQIDLATAIAYNKLGYVEKSLQLLVAFDSLYTSSVQIGNARFEKASIYEKTLKNYDSAMVYYQKALSSSATSEYLPMIRERAGIFNKYAVLCGSLTDNKKQFYYAQYPSEYTKDSLQFVTDTAKTRTTVVKDTTVKVVQVLERERRFEEVEGDEATAQLAKLLIRDTLKAAKLPPRKPVVTADSLKILLAKNTLELGNLFLTDLNIADSAYYYYNQSINEYECKQFLPKALFSLGSYYLTINDSTRADSIFVLIYDNYKYDRIVNEAAKKLGRLQIDFEFDPAKEKFLEAEKLFRQKEYADSYHKFYDIGIQYKTSKYAPKALMAAGKILEDNIRLADSAAVVYDSLVVKYPTSAAAIKIYPKITFYKDEKKRLRQVIEDSLRAINDAKLAALAADSIKTAVRADSLKRTGKVDSVATVVPGVVADSVKAKSLMPEDSTLKSKQIIKPQGQLKDSTGVKKPGIDPILKDDDAVAGKKTGKNLHNARRVVKKPISDSTDVPAGGNGIIPKSHNRNNEDAPKPDSTTSSPAKGEPEIQSFSQVHRNCRNLMAGNKYRAVNYYWLM